MWVRCFQQSLQPHVHHNALVAPASCVSAAGGIGVWCDGIATAAHRFWRLSCTGCLCYLCARLPVMCGDFWPRAPAQKCVSVGLQVRYSIGCKAQRLLQGAWRHVPLFTHVRPTLHMPSAFVARPESRAAASTWVTGCWYASTQHWVGRVSAVFAVLRRSAVNPT